MYRHPPVSVLVPALALAVVLIAHSSAFAGGFLGEPIAQVERSGFFGWFSLEKTAERPGAGGTRIITFQPSGAKFHDLARVEATLGRDQRIVEIDLVLARSFVESSSDGIFANDIAKSFLRAAVPDSDAGAVADLADEIEASATTDRPLLEGPHAPVTRPTEPSPGFLVFLGRRDSYQLTLSTASLALGNFDSARGRELRISFTRSTGA